MRTITVGAAQLGPIARDDSRATVVMRLIVLLREARHRDCDLVVFPELALTTFFPRWYMTDRRQLDAFFEHEMPGRDTKALFDEARRLGLAFCLGYAELTDELGTTRRYNTSILVDATGRITGKYRKIHLSERRYFDAGDLGFGVWRMLGGLVGMCICDDRLWPETYRVMGLQGVEMIVLGYNTPVHDSLAPQHDLLANFHNQLVMQAGAYQNGTWVVGVAKCGREEGMDQIGQSQIIAPSGETVAMAATLGDELIVARCDLDLCRSYKTTVFDFARHRRPEHYRLITERTGAIPPA
jgi:N-carbamoyl-D-amino-acid hydrolase